jgi:peptidoglycan/xylan/chitin deacetylase (PgdA/CDA1 family)
MRYRIAAAALASFVLASVSAQTPPPAQVQVSASAAAQSTARSVAITIDDGPAVSAGDDLGAFLRISTGLITAFQAEKVPVTIFVNESQLNVPGQRDPRAAVLDQWLNAGFDVGNHGYSHQSANQVTFEQFADDVVKGEVVTRPLLERRGKTLSWFRYPYLHSGQNAEAHDAIGRFLDSRGYRVAHITVDYADYAFAGPYSRALRAGDFDRADRIRQAYVAQADLGFEHAEKASLEVFGREIPQILLIHCNELNAMHVRETIARMRQRGYRFITLDEATRDPVYARPDTFTGPGGSWLSRSATAAGRRIETSRNPGVPGWVTATP